MNPQIIQQVVAQKSVGGDEGYWDIKCINASKSVNKSDLKPDPGMRAFKKNLIHLLFQK